MAIRYTDQTSKPKSNIRYLDEKKPQEIKRREGESIPFKMGGIKMGGKTLPMPPGFDIGSTIQNMGALAQREESAISAPIEAAKEGRFNDIGSEFVKGARGDNVTELGGVLERSGMPSGVASTLGFAGSMAMPTNLLTTAATGGANKIATPKLAGLTQKIGSPVGRFLRSVADIPQSTVEKSRELTGKYGKKFVHSHAKVEPGFIGKDMAPKVGKTVSDRVISLDPVALRENGIADDAVAEIQKVSSEHGIKRLPTIVEANDIFQKSMSGAPEDMKFNVKGLKDEIGNILRENGVIDESGETIPGLVRDNTGFSYLHDMWKGLKSRISKNKKIPDLLAEDATKLTKSSKINKAGDIVAKEGTSGKIGTVSTGMPSKESQDAIIDALKFTDEIDKKSFMRTRANLLAQVTGDAQIDRHTYRVIDALDTAAEKAGVPGISKAKAEFKLSRLGEMAHKKINDPSFLEETEGSLRSAVNPEHFQLREALKRLIGQGGDKLIDELESINIGRQFQSKGFVPSRTGILEKGAKGIVGKFEKERARLIDLVKGKKVPGVVKKTLGLAERATLRKLIQGDQD